jgi:adenylate kinase family enzyme
MSKLIIIRGPSGAGKSTVAKALFEKATRPTALLGRDHYMFMFKASGDVDVPDKELIQQNILTCLDRGFDVIFEGNFRMSSHQPMLERLFKAHPNENYVFYLDVSLEETLRRHEGREQIISADKLKELYEFATPMNHSHEVIIPGHTTAKDTVKLIQQTAKI